MKTSFSLLFYLKKTKNYIKGTGPTHKTFSAGNFKNLKVSVPEIKFVMYDICDGDDWTIRILYRNSDQKVRVARNFPPSHFHPPKY